jgi:dTDP-4-amino-4,6-dideoxygalactose transaminase
MTDRNIARVSAWLVGRMDVPEIRERRRRNYTRLLDRISHIANLEPLFPGLPPGVCPLSLPVLVKGARELARKLQAQSIPAIAWWSGYHRFFPATGEFEEARYLKDSVVALPIHQQLADRSVDFIADKTIESLAQTDKWKPQS